MENQENTAINKDIYCSQCGTKNKGEDNFCMNCGNNLKLTDEPNENKQINNLVGQNNNEQDYDKYTWVYIVLFITTLVAGTILFPILGSLIVFIIWGIFYLLSPKKNPGLGGCLKAFLIFVIFIAIIFGVCFITFLG